MRSMNLLSCWVRLDLGVFLKNQGKSETEIFSILQSCCADQLRLWMPYAHIPKLDFSYMIAAANPSLQAGRAALMACFLRANRAMEDVREVAQHMGTDDFKIAERFQQDRYSDKARMCFVENLLMLAGDGARLDQFFCDLLELDMPHADQLYVILYSFTSDRVDVRRLFSKLEMGFVPENDLGNILVCVESLVNRNKGQEALQRFLSARRGDCLLTEYQGLLREVVTVPGAQVEETRENPQDDALLLCVAF